MNRRSFSVWMTVALALVALACGFDQGRALAAYIPPTVLGTPDYFGVANYANSPLPAGSITAILVTNGGSGYSATPTVIISDPSGAGATTVTATVVGGVITGIAGGLGGSGYIAPQVMITDATGKDATATATIGGTLTGGIRKFVDALPGLCAVTGPTATLGQCLPLATPDNTTFPGSDYYSIGLSDYTQKMHSDLAPSRLRGYVQLDATGNPVGPHQYLGPLILATKNKPVRVKFTNMLPTGNAGDLFMPVDTTYMGAGQGPDGTWYSQNRATLHLHGGNTPWISDGTPHQWVTPAGETDVSYPKGDSFQNVPDMVTGPQCADPTGAGCITPSANDGTGTFFWTNEQGGRLMFYHDHAYGMTRLNVYAGEAAGYLLVDPAEENTLASATAPGTLGTTADLAHLVPLVIQDKTFVPPTPQLTAEDPTWNTTLYGGTGNLWFPHVYMPNQNPYDLGGANAFGRWDYGPWFWPPQTSLTGAGGALTVPCTSSAYPGATLECPITPNPSGVPEGFMDTPVVNGTAYPVLHVAPAAYRFQILSAGNDRTLNLQLYVGDLTGKDVTMLPAASPAVGTALPLCTTPTRISDPSNHIGLALGALDATGNPLNGTGLPANCWPTTWPTDGRDGGVPDPRTAGPPFIQIGSEGGLLPAPVVIPSTPTGFEYNRRSITVLSISTHGLLVGPAERADVIVDFSAFAGKTLILYNDAPAPVPAFDTRNDYYTGGPDQTSTGGAAPTQPGYGPNTRTVMQIVVDQTAPNAVPFNLATLQGAFASTATTTGVFAATQPFPLVPESTYNSAFDVTLPDTFSRIQSTSLTFTDPGAATATAHPLLSKTIQELFTLDYGRMNATLGTELPFTNFQTQTTIPLGYIDPPTEVLKDGATQLWKITHNGVDTHFIHFHLFNVQVINRVGWDGAVKPPDPNELG